MQNKKNHSAWLCVGLWGMLACVQMLMHLNCDNLLLDDWVFYAVKENGMSILDFLALRWQTWSSRLLIEGLLSIVTHSIWAWRVLDSLAMVLMAWSLCRLSNTEKKPEMVAMSALLVTSLPFGILRSTGWMATSLNYYVPLACTLMALVPLADAFYEKKTSVGCALGAVCASLIGANQEQTAAVIVSASLILLMVRIVQKRHIPMSAVLVLTIGVVELTAHLMCPGNAIRAEESIALVNLRDYGQFTLIDKLSIGLTSTTTLLFIGNPIGMACWACTFYACIERRRGASLWPFAMLWFAALRTLGWGPDSFDTYVLQWGPQYIAQLDHGIMMATLVIMLVMMALSLYICIGHRALSAYAVLIFAIGFGARMALSFSPTVVESGERTMLPLYGAMILCTLMCLRDVGEERGSRWTMCVSLITCAMMAGLNMLMSFLLAM